MDDLAFSVNSILVTDDEAVHSFMASDKMSSIDIDQQSYNYYNYVRNVASNIHPRLLLYKKTFNELSSNQDERRRLILLEQKKKRQNQIDESRSLDSQEEVEPNDVNSGKHHRKWNQAAFNQYKDKLMFSEWLEERPNDFKRDWIWTFCPVGKRCLVVATEGYTSVFNKSGKLICKHSSGLPGGNRESRAGKTMLDCVYSEPLRTYFVLDCLCWNSHPIVDTESEFRFYWLKCKLDESTNLKVMSSLNPYIFKDLTRYYDFSEADTYQRLSAQFEFEIDGILFYHREGLYTSGHTPLVGWLKCYMLPEILNIAVPESTMASAPSDYTGAQQTIDQSNINIQRLKDFLKKRTKTGHFRLNTSPTSQLASIGGSLDTANDTTLEASKMDLDKCSSFGQ